MANGSFLGQKTKITVVRKLKLDDVAREYGQIRPGADNGDFIPDCPFFQEGQACLVVTQFTCCTDGLRPVVFKVQSMETDGESV